MHITKIELDNIKSYRHAVIPLRGGTTAIRGQNGAGKSTLVEAIGFALFDAINYKQAQFVREGEKWGQVAVTFVSALDDREYQVVRRCGSSSEWYVYDLDLQDRLVEQRADVLAFLRQHLRIEGEIKLSALFADALGVPQGTFTADFLLTPADRKKKFDTLLQVEDYRKAAEKLNETRNYLQEQHHAQERRIDALERETGQLPDWRARLEAGTIHERELTVQLARINQEAAAVEARRDALRRAEAEANRLDGALQVAAAGLQAAEARLREADARAEEARTAVQVCEATRADHAAYVAAERDLGAARERERERTSLRTQRAALASQLEGAARDVEHARARVAEAVGAERRVAELRPLAAQQHDLETRQQALQRQVEQLAEGERQRAKARAEQERLAGELAEARRTLEALEALRPEAEHRAAHAARLEAAQAALAARAQQEKRLAANRDEGTQARAAREKAAVQERKARENVRKIEAQRATVERLPALEAEYAALDDEVRRLEALQEQHRLSRQQSGQGNCPFLREPCLNIQRRGENNLATYFDRLLEEGDRALAPLRTRRDDASHALQKTQTIRGYFERLSEYQEQAQQAGDHLAQVEAQLARLLDEEGELARALAGAPDAAALEAARAAFRRSDEADRQRATLPMVQQQSDRLLEQCAALDADLAQLEARLAALAAAPRELLAVSGELERLGDVRAEGAAQARVAHERPQHEASLAAATARASEIEAELGRLDEALRPYADVDARLGALDATLARTRDGHTRHLQHERLAARLGEYEAALLESRQNRQQALAAHTAARTAYDAARAGFDADELARASARADALRAERGRTTEELRYTQETGARLAAEIARVEALEAELTGAREERQTLDDLERMLQQFRETIKEAGPRIMQAVLRHISVEANRIFGEILGDRSAQLAWEADYEIVLRRDGRERTFALLSGGEQMSAALAVRLALLRNLTRLDIAFFDEPTQNMDGERRGNLAEQIRRIRGFDQLLVISHDDTFEQGLDSVIYLEKRNGETVLADEEILSTA